MQIEIKKNNGIVTYDDEIAKIISLMVEMEKKLHYSKWIVFHCELVIQCFFYNDLQIKNLMDHDMIYFSDMFIRKHHFH